MNQLQYNQNNDYQQNGDIFNQIQRPKPTQEYEIYKRLKLLGEGSFGKAYLVESQSDKSKWVIKQISLDAMSPEEKKESYKEAKILEQLNHPNIVKFKEIYKTKSGKLCIVMEYADGGDLSQKIQKQRGKYFKEEQILDWFTQICLAMKHVHDRKILHRDLKGQNIFLTSQNICKLGDFGIARVLNKTFEKAKTMVGTPYYLSPEIINSVPYSYKSDVWSIGVVLYEMCCLRPPFQGESLQNLALNIVKGQYQPIPNIYSQDLKKLVSNLLQNRPESRYSIQQILGLPFIRNRIKNFLSETIKANEFSHTILHNQKIIIDDDFKNIKNVQGPPPPSVAYQMKEQQRNAQEKQDQQQQQKVLPSIEPKQAAQKAPQNQKQNQIEKQQIRPQTPVSNQVRPINGKIPIQNQQYQAQNQRPSNIDVGPQNYPYGKIPNSQQQTPIGKENSSDNKKIVRQPSKNNIVNVKYNSVPTEQEEKISQQPSKQTPPLPPQPQLKQNPSQQKFQKAPQKPVVQKLQRPSTAVPQNPQRQIMTPKSQPGSKPFYPPKPIDRKQSAGQILVSNQVSKGDQNNKPPISNNRPITAHNRNSTPQRISNTPPVQLQRNVRQEISQKRQDILNKVKDAQEQKKKKLEDLKKAKMEASLKSKEEREQVRQNMYKDIKQKRQGSKPSQNVQQVQQQQQQNKKEEIQIEWMGTLKPDQPPERPKYIDQKLEEQKIAAEKYNQEMALRKKKEEEIEKQKQLQEQMYEENKREREKKQRELFLMDMQENSNPQNYPQKGFAHRNVAPQNRQEIEYTQMLEEMKSLIDEPPCTEDNTTNDSDQQQNINQNLNFEDVDRDDYDDQFDNNESQGNTNQKQKNNNIQQQQDEEEYIYTLPNNKQSINAIKENYVKQIGKENLQKLQQAIKSEIKKNRKFVDLSPSDKIKILKQQVPSIKFDKVDLKINQLVDIVQIENS
ncbi:plant dual-specificity MAP kinase kinase family domain protein (macronuclear) [Tetrahymena thermophila SB210]|uniref:non-specific serine/threonine protein kinase n=1 Tax=Tetrahymena thermophila (strain SB210) TaxID=312017 RepID=I7LTD1_TETTS|nr:plant dual-specificity MAP kinase kinase family domain protein [Tetrahymena thermophila SB210]EAR85026.2 plant dual-specificity MAP kinase kinase family domain protein [Tetrahymena thermophila SB210]|eukprot:XP_001032689.2 plant dual-specificity MAP kinase kinase family domain protein [Tetrahymena thermophila SB210]